LIAEVEQRTLASGFVRSVELFPERPALDVAGTTISYEELHRRALAIAGVLVRTADGNGPRLTGVLGSRSAGTFAAILGVLLSGDGYVPLNASYPAARNREILERSGCRTIIADDGLRDTAEEVLAGMAAPARLLLADAADESQPPPSLPEPAVDDPAYLLFTSGSTGRPKGVLVTHANVRAFLTAVGNRYDLNETDRLSQLFDLTFDLSVFDLFAAWENGACVCCPDDRQRLEPSGFVRSAALTVWFSVPSVAMLMQRLGRLEPGTFPGLRLSLFCGEALPAELAAAWSAAAPNSVVENLYGPTEATIACTVQRWNPAAESGANGLVPIGRPFGETATMVVDESFLEVPAGKPGQLLLGGPQVVSGYLDDDAATAAAFSEQEGLGRAYATGDRVFEPRPGAPLEYLGRMDSQIKVLGHRVELGEVEAAIRQEAGANAVAVGWPQTPSGAAGIVAFVADPSIDRVALRRALGTRLPNYMMPRELRLVADLPLNANGKHDRKALLELLEHE
jgi:amino acid adenylation domain-containing protein